MQRKKHHSDNDQDQVATAMGQRAELLDDLFERIPPAVWVPCPKGRHHINAIYYPSCPDCDRDQYEREQRGKSRKPKR